MITRRYGHIPDKHDPRDLKFTHVHAAAATLPASVDLRAQCPPVVDQGGLGSCTANALVAAIAFDVARQGGTEALSRLFVYYNERSVEGTITDDSGAEIRDGAKVAAVFGAPPETVWPYSDANPGPFSQEPPQAVFAAALATRVTSYMRVAQDLADMRACLSAGFPIVAGFTVYASFESDAVAATGVVPMPAPGEDILGGHAVLIVGYDDASQKFLCRNSWGASWGMAGYFTMPYAYLTDATMASDFWTLRAVTA